MKKIGVYFIIVMMMLVIVVGCTKKESKETKTDSVSNKEVTKEKTENDTKVEDNTDKVGTFPIVEDKITLTFFAPHPSNIEDLSTNEFTKHMEELTNIHIEWETVPTQGLKEKRNLLLASGDYPDVFFGAELSKEEEMLYGSQGILVPLNPLIDKYGVEIKQHFNDIDWLEKVLTTPDGNIYTLPEINECYHCTRSQKMWINQAWLDKLNLKMPTTTEEFKQVLTAFKEKDPNGNNKQDEIPLTGAIKGWHTELPDFLMCAFIYCDGDSNSYRVQMNNGKVELIADKPEFKQGLRYINSLYKEGLIDAEAFTQTREQLLQVGENPEAQVIGASTSGWFGYFASLSGERQKDYRALEPLKGPNGVQYTAYYPFGYNPGAFAITNKNKYPEQTIRWVDYLFSEEGTRLCGDGREGIEWEKAKDGEIGIDGRPAKWKQIQLHHDVQNAFYSGLGPKAVTSEYRNTHVRCEDVYSADGLETRLYQETKEKYEGKEPEQVFPPLYMSTDQIDEMAQLKSPITDYIKESMARFITGNLDIDNDWETYVQGLNNLGAERYTQLLQEAYDNSAFAK